MISRQQSGAVSYYLKNAHGDIVYTLNDSRTKTATYKYSAWGETMDEYDSNTSSPNPIKYSGEYEDSESGMIYLRGRYYDPELRRFITEDPAKDGLNWYAYCGNNPVMYVDPWGLADDPENGVKSLNYVIDCLMVIINNKVDYNNGEKNESHESAEKERKKVEKILYNNDTENNIYAINSYSENLCNLVKEVVVNGNGTLQETSALLAVFVELRYDIINGSYMPGDEVISEDMILEKYYFHVGTGDIYLAGDKAYNVAEKILPINYTEVMQNTFTGDTKWGYWVKIIVYDKYLQGTGDVVNTDAEDWWESING